MNLLRETQSFKILQLAAAKQCLVYISPQPLQGGSRAAQQTVHEQQIKHKNQASHPLISIK